ncbi:MAG: hypothetical protein Q7S52_01800 [bacterium]|nr:hypothetical protein [bacterium]
MSKIPNPRVGFSPQLSSGARQSSVSPQMGITQPAVKGSSDTHTKLPSNPQGLDYTVRKAEKLTTALYLVTDIMPEREPLKWKVREVGVDLLSDITIAVPLSASEKMSMLRNIMKKVEKTVAFLDVAQSARLMSEMNSSMLKKEYLALKDNIEAEWSRVYEGSKQMFSETFFDVPPAVSLPAHPSLGAAGSSNSRDFVRESGVSTEESITPHTPQGGLRSLLGSERGDLEEVGHPEGCTGLQESVLSAQKEATVHMPREDMQHLDEVAVPPFRSTSDVVATHQTQERPSPTATPPPFTPTPLVVNLPARPPLGVAGQSKSPVSFPPTPSAVTKKPEEVKAATPPQHIQMFEQVANTRPPATSVSNPPMFSRPATNLPNFQRRDGDRDDRRKIILALIKQKPALTIRDITKSIPQVSEKTIQRELLSMVGEGILQKRGERRWSTYSLRVQ